MVKKRFKGELTGAKKAQSTMDFFLTYGWALILVAILITLLFTFGVLKPIFSECNLPVGFDCVNAHLSTNGIAQLEITQSSGVLPQTITAIGCATNQTTIYDQNIKPFTIQPGQTVNITVQCYNGNKQFSGQIGTQFHGYIIINYTNPQSRLSHVNFGVIIHSVDGGQGGNGQGSTSVSTTINGASTSYTSTIPGNVVNGTTSTTTIIATTTINGASTSYTSTIPGNVVNGTTSTTTINPIINGTTSTTTIVPVVNGTTSTTTINPIINGTTSTTTIITTTTTIPGVQPYSLIVITDISEQAYGSDIITQTSQGESSTNVGVNTTEGYAGPYNSSRLIVPGAPFTTYGTGGTVSQNMPAGYDAAFAGSLCVNLPDGEYGNNQGVQETFSVNAGPLSKGPNGQLLCGVGDGETPFALDSVSMSCLYNGCVYSLNYTSTGSPTTGEYVTIPPNSIVELSWTRTNPYVTYKNTIPDNWTNADCGLPSPGNYQFNPVGYGSVGGFATDYNGGGTLSRMNENSSNPGNAIQVEDVVTPENVTENMGGYGNYTYMTELNNYTFTNVTSQNYWCFNGNEAVQFLGWEGQANGTGINPGYSGPDPQFVVKDLKNNITETAKWGSTIYEQYTLSTVDINSCSPMSPYKNFWGYAPVGTTFTFTQPTTCPFNESGTIYTGISAWAISNFALNVPANPACTGAWTCYGPAQILCSGTGTLTLEGTSDQKEGGASARSFGYWLSQTGDNWHSSIPYGAPYLQCG